ncbi:MAG: DMT family transporter [Deltaproteobacteria bacterium]|nr:DMT family transporter [Deltaproteobacteria bacterium]
MMSWQALAAVIFWGFSFIATKVALREVHPFTLLAIRYAIGALMLLFIQLGRERSFLKLFSLWDWVYIFILAALGVSGLGLLQAYGLLYTTAINTGWIIAINPILIALSARFFLGETITVRKVFGILLGFCGIFLIISKGIISISLFRMVSTYGDLLVLASALAWTAYTIGGKGFISRFPPLTTVTVIMISGCLTVLPLSLLKGEWGSLLHLSSHAWAGILFLGIFCSGLGYLFWYSALEKRDSGIVGMYLYVEPFATMIGAYLLLGEEIRWITMVGGGMTLAGVYFATRNRYP